MAEVLSHARPQPPAYWISALAERCLELLDRGRMIEMQDEVKREAAKQGLAPMAVANYVAQEWDRIGFVTGDRRRLVV